MFDLDSAIAEWRRQMTSGGVGAAEALDELEGHLRDDVERQTGAGVGARDAFASSVARLGRADLLGREFGKIGGIDAGRARVKRVFFTLAGLPKAYLETDMNAPTANPNLEPRWATYTKAAVFLAPAICLWTISMIFLIPKLKQICRVAGVALPSIYGMTDFIADHFILAVGATILLLVMLERRWNRWPQYRRASLGGAVFLVNASVLALITLMVVLALLAAPDLMHHVP